MAKKSSSSGGSELNLDSLMDAVTNVVGVLMIVFVVMAINTARIVQKILSDLPPVTEQEAQKMKDQVNALPPPIADPKKIEEEKIKAQTDLQKVLEELKTVDTADLAKKFKEMDLDSYKKQLEEAKKKREANKAATDKLLAEVERLKALLDQTPVFTPPPATVIRLPNPRPYPKKPVETRVLVAKQGVLFFQQTKFMQPILDGLEKVKSQLQFERVEYPPFAKVIEKHLGTPAAGGAAWPHIATLINRKQLEEVAQAYKILADAALQPNKQVLEAIADISIPTRSTMPVVAAAIVAAGKGDLTLWTKLDPSRDPATPIIKATRSGNNIIFSWGAKSAEAKATPKDVLDYFVKELAKMPNIEDASQARTIYDATRIAAMLQRAAANPLIAGSYTFEPVISPTGVVVTLKLTPKAGGGISLAQLTQPNSPYVSQLRDIKKDPSGVAIFQVMPDAFETYHTARQIADQEEIPATWEFLSTLELTASIAGYEVQRTAPAPVANPAAANRVRIAAPKRSLD
jgi:hypothetical protein